MILIRCVFKTLLYYISKVTFGMATERGHQPVRLLPIREGFKSKQRYCVAAATWTAAMADVLGQTTCMTVASGEHGSSADIHITETKNDSTYDYAQTLTDGITRLSAEPTIQASNILHFQQELAKLPRYLPTVSLRFRAYVRPVAERLFACDALWRVITVGTPGHIAIVLWNTARHTAELFDSGGIYDDETHKMVIMTLRQLLPADVRIDTVNTEYLQGEDSNCQTWIWYFVYHRVALGERASVIVHRLKVMTAMQRFHEINRFWHYLLKIQAQRHQTQQEPFAQFRLYARRRMSTPFQYYSH